MKYASRETDDIDVILFHHHYSICANNYLSAKKNCQSYSEIN